MSTSSSTSSAKHGFDLTALAASLSQQDGDGHRWNEEEARQWLNRMGIAIPAKGAEVRPNLLPSPAAALEDDRHGQPLSRDRF
jgi:hypothetical protein